MYQTTHQMFFSNFISYDQYTNILDLDINQLFHFYLLLLFENIINLSIVFFIILMYYLKLFFALNYIHHFYIYS